MDALPQTTTGTTSPVLFDNTSLSPSTSSTGSSITTYTPSTCLFCPHPSQDIDSNLHHMSKSHNFFIPDPEYLSDISSFLTFLDTVISKFHECLFCGSTRSNKFAVQDHMKSKGHCRIDLEDECEEWAEFWDYPCDEEGREEDGTQKEENELHLKSGKTLGHRSRARYFRQTPNRTTLSPLSPSRQLHCNRTINPESQSHLSTSTSLAIRAGTSTSLIGVPELQWRTLRATEKKTAQMETRAKNSYQAGVDRHGNVQKFFVVLRRRERVFGSV